MSPIDNKPRVCHLALGNYLCLHLKSRWCRYNLDLGTSYLGILNQHISYVRHEHEIFHCAFFSHDYVTWLTFMY